MRRAMRRFERWPPLSRMRHARRIAARVSGAIRSPSSYRESPARERFAMSVCGLCRRWSLCGPLVQTTRLRSACQRVSRPSLKLRRFRLPCAKPRWIVTDTDRSPLASARGARSYISSSTFPVVWRPSRSRCAWAASASGYVAPMRTSSLPAAMRSNSSFVRPSNSSRVRL